MVGQYEAAIDISKVPGKHDLEEDGDKNNEYYYQDGKEGIIVILTENLPKAPGYKKLEYKPEDQVVKIKGIKKGDTPQNVLPNPSGYSNVTEVAVYYWELDSSYSNPLLIQLVKLGIDEEYYTSTPENPNYWTKQGGINNSNLKDRLDKQNCKNGVHTVKISYKIRGTTSYSLGYYCPVCNQRITVSYLDPPDHDHYHYYSHTIGHPGSSSSISVSGFKDKDNYQVGLPPVKGAQFISVYWRQFTGKPLLIAYQQNYNTTYWFKRNASDGNTWSEVSPNLIPDPRDTSHYRNKIKELLDLKEYYPKLTPDLSKIDKYSDSSGISIIVKVVSRGAYIIEHSLNGQQFKLDKVKHKSKVLKGISSDYPLIGVRAYYDKDGNPETEDKFDLVELAVQILESGIHYTRYIYYGRPTTTRENSWYAFLNLGTRPSEEDLRKEVDRINELKDKKYSMDDIVKASLKVAKPGVGAGVAGLGTWKLWSVLATLV
ncbi:hypothetical protein BEWA_036100 [Theileria equi strain WA]|uniref:Uncharacterized protein n=1 Tax=Theileria equi strain WA TaxID=1537102 RepID=L1LE65_THEEQ|nr:hypothetical protein BEWA_036100 [Theileria equi strain WA]EKX73574.1 hypothetical protein BEWA_036100 [Theileria equi strain WA]|eukprot:XP_004833026.1 hypothetical protein BEWA_036100 [Theileria equi strain WA]